MSGHADLWIDQCSFEKLLRQLTWRFGRDLAHDALQQALVKSRERRDQLRNEASLVPWIRTTAFREAYDILRGNHRMTAIEDVGEPSLPSGLSVEAIDVNIAMAKLPRGQRQSLEAKYYDDFSGAEIAVAMNATEMAVYGQLARARGALRVLLPSYVRRRQAKPRVGSQRRRNSHANDRKTEN